MPVSSRRNPAPAPDAASRQPILSVRDMDVTFPSPAGPLYALRGLSFDLAAGQRLGFVGESGAGKSMAAFAVLNLVSEPGRISGGSVVFEGTDLTKAHQRHLRHVRGNRIAMIFQDPMMTLNPVLTIGAQMTEVLRTHMGVGAAQARERAIEKLREVAIPSPETRIDAYPHELSGGLRQRVVIAIALLTDPAIIIADEPTTALDVTIQAEILALLLDLCARRQMGLILITHDLAVVSQVTQDLIVLYAGTVAEAGPTAQVLRAPRHPYTRGLLRALPQNNAPGAPLAQIPGAMPSLGALPSGCAFWPRCPHADDHCRTDIPPLRLLGAGHRAACHHAERIAAEATPGSGDGMPRAQEPVEW